MHLKVKCKTVFYWDIFFENYKGEKMLYSCVAPNKGLAIKSFACFMGTAKYNLLSCTTDGKRYALN